MKKIWCCFLIIIPILLTAQNEERVMGSPFKGFLSGGLNATQIAGDLLAGYKKPGGTFGVGTFIMYTPNWSNSMEINYSMKGSQSTLSSKDPSGYVKYVLDYVEIPIQVNYHDFEVAIFHAGFTVGRLVRQRTVSPVISILDVDARDWSFDATVGATFLIKKHWGVNLKASFSLMNALNGQFKDGNTIVSRARNGGWYHNALSLRAMYFF